MLLHVFLFKHCLAPKGLGKRFDGAENSWNFPSINRVPTGQGKLEKLRNLCGQGKVEKNISEKSKKIFLDHADCRYL